MAYVGRGGGSFLASFSTGEKSGGLGSIGSIVGGQAWGTLLGKVLKRIPRECQT